MSVDPLAEKFFQISQYAYVLNNPMMFVDPDGKDVVTWLVNSFKQNGTMNATKGYASKTFIKGMSDFAKTDYGKSYLLQFMKKGQSVYGATVSSNGKFSNQNLNLIDMKLTNALPSEKGNTFLTSDGAKWEGKTVFPDEINDLDLNVYFNSDGESSIELGETIAHELGLHGNKYAKIIEALKKGKSTKNISEPGKDHDALRTADEESPSYRFYNQIMKQLELMDVRYKQERVNEKEKYERK